MALARFGLYPFRSPLLRVSRLLSFPRGTEMFQFPRFPPAALCVQTAVTLHDECWVSPFGHPRIEAQSTAPRGFSQSLTSFIGSWRQGIHRWLFVAWKRTRTGAPPPWTPVACATRVREDNPRASLVSFAWALAHTSILNPRWISVADGVSVGGARGCPPCEMLVLALQFSRSDAVQRCRRARSLEAARCGGER